MEQTFQLRLTLKDRQLFERSAKSRRMSVAEFLRQAGREKAAETRTRAACLDYTDRIELSAAAEENPKAFIRARLKSKKG